MSRQKSETVEVIPYEEQKSLKRSECSLSVRG